jgi:hypothetical protein
MGLLDAETMDEDGAVEIFKLTDRYCIAGPSWRSTSSTSAFAWRTSSPLQCSPTRTPDPKLKEVGYSSSW